MKKTRRKSNTRMTRRAQITKKYDPMSKRVKRLNTALKGMRT